MSKYEVNGHIVEFANEPSEQDIDEAAKQLGPSQPEKKPIIGGLAGQGLDIAFNKAPAGIREGIRAGVAGGMDNEDVLGDMAQGFKKGYQNPNKSQNFQDQALEGYYNKFPQEDIASSKHPYLAAAKNTVNEIGGLVPSAMGMAADFVTNPGQVGTAIATDGLVKSLGNTQVGQLVGKALNKPLEQIPGDIANATKDIPDMLKAGTTNLSPENLTNKAQKLTTEVLQPPKGYLQNYFEKGQTPPAVEEGSNAISKSKNYTEVRNKINDNISDLFTIRNEMLKDNNKPIGNSYIDNLDAYIKKQESMGQDPHVEQMKEVLQKEKDFIKNNSNLDKISGQARKEELQDMTNVLLQKNERGDIIDTQPGRNRALDKLREGLKQAVEDGDPLIAEINSKYGGLLKAKEFAAGQEALSKKEIPPSLWERLPIIKTILNPKDSIQEGLSSAAAKNSKSLGRKTGKIQELMDIINKRNP